MPELKRLTIENCPDMETFISNSVVHVTTDNKEPQKLTSEENFLLAHQVQPLFDENVIIIIIIFPFTFVRIDVISLELNQI